MIKYLLLISLAFLLQCKPDEPKPTGLMIEFIREPGRVSILDDQPEYTWIVPENIKTQTAYQILVATSIEEPEGLNADIWDSGKVNDHTSVEIEHKGLDLSDTTNYFWMVRVWGDGNNKPSPYSEIQSFRTGRINGYQTSSNQIQRVLIKPEKTFQSDPGNYFVDFGKDAFSQLGLTLTSGSDDTIIVHLGEKLSALHQIDTSPGGSIRYQKIILPVKKGKKEYTVFPVRNKRNTSGSAVMLPDTMGVVLPFRYCGIEGLKQDIKLEQIWQNAYYYYYDDDASLFTSSDTLLNKIWNLCKYSIKATSFAGLYVDGDRERIPYEGDAYINQLGHYCVDREYSMARRTNEYFIKHPTWPTEWILHTVPMFYNDYIYTGNSESLEYFYEDLKYKTLKDLARTDGLISSRNANREIMKKLGFSNPEARMNDLVDWPPAQKDTGWKLATPEGERDGYDMVEINTVVNSFYFKNLILMAEIAGYLNKKQDSLDFQQKADQVKESINTKLFDKKKGIYVDGENSDHSSLHANMMPLAFGLVPEEHIASVVAFIKSRGMACSVYGAQYLLEGLYEAGEEDYAVELLTSTSDRSWYNMIRSGSTITMEAWDLKYKPNADWNHAWGAAPANIIPRGLWGIRPLKPGFSEVIIQPQLGELSHSKIKVPTIRGTVYADYKILDDQVEFIIQLPPNMTGNFVIPSKYNNRKISQDNHPVKSTIETLSLQSGLNKITLTRN
jgi:hypothetical protein